MYMRAGNVRFLLRLLPSRVIWIMITGISDFGQKIRIRYYDSRMYYITIEPTAYLLFVEHSNIFVDREPKKVLNVFFYDIPMRF